MTDITDRREIQRAEDRILNHWRPWLENLTDDTYELVTLLVRGTCEAAELNERYDINRLAESLDTTRSAIYSRFCHFRVPSCHDIQARVWLLCIIDRREDMARRWYNRRFTLSDAYGAAGLATLQGLARFLKRTVPAMKSASEWIRTADFADVATSGARFLFDSPNWQGFHATQRNNYDSRPTRLSAVPRCSECGRPSYGRERNPL